MQKRLFGIIAIFGTATSMSGCVVYGPKAEYKSPLNVLNGENYDTSADSVRAGGLPIPVIKTKERLTIIRGVVIRREGITDIPMKRIAVELRSGSGELIEIATSDSNGVYAFARELKNGLYTLKAAVGGQVAVRRVAVDSYLLEGVDLLLDDGGK